MLDGTLISFVGKPGILKDQAADYFNHHKQQYDMQATVVYDDENRNTYFTCLYPGSLHDSRAFKTTAVRGDQGNLDSEVYFSNQYQFILADTAYNINNQIISLYKRKKGDYEKLLSEKAHFN